MRQVEFLPRAPLDAVAAPLRFDQQGSDHPVGGAVADAGADLAQERGLLEGEGEEHGVLAAEAYPSMLPVAGHGTTAVGEHRRETVAILLGRAARAVDVGHHQMEAVVDIGTEPHHIGVRPKSLVGVLDVGPYWVEDKAVSVCTVAANRIAFLHAGAAGGGAQGSHAVVDADGVVGVGGTHLIPATGSGDDGVVPPAHTEVEPLLPFGADDGQRSGTSGEAHPPRFAVALLLRHHILRHRKVGRRLIPPADAPGGPPVGIGLVDIAEEGAGVIGRVEAKLQAHLGEGAEVSVGSHQVAQLHASVGSHLQHLLHPQALTVGGGEVHQHLHLGGVLALGEEGLHVEHTSLQMVEPLPGPGPEGVDQVVLGRRPPEAAPQRRGQQLVPVVAVAGDAAVVAVDHQADAPILQHHTALGVADTYDPFEGHCVVWAVGLGGKDVVAATGVDSLHLVGMGMRRSVGSQQAIGAEGVVVLQARQLAQVAAGSPPLSG